MDIKLPSNIKNQLLKVNYDSIATLTVYSHTLENLSNPKLLNDSNFKKIIDNSSKYNYSNFTSYLIHLRESITNNQNFTTKEEIKNFITKKVFQVSFINLEEDFYIIPHFWKYALVSTSLDIDHIYDMSLELGICGDYFNGKDLEGSYLSSKSLYEQRF